ncbi:MAG: guanylate kinase [Pseudomonadota bacterium]
MSATLYIVAAPSGAGKTTLVRRLLNDDTTISLSLSATTRAPRQGEQDGYDYRFLATDDFLARIKQGEFLEWALVHGNYYGTSKSEIERTLAKGQDVLLEIDWQGAQQIRQQFANTVSIFILPPSLAVLAQRLATRGTDDAATIARRLAAAQEEMRHVDEFDYVIINEDLQLALSDLNAVVRASRLRSAVQRQKNPQLFENLTH